jgi:hypothetical protein
VRRALSYMRSLHHTLDQHLRNIQYACHPVKGTVSQSFCIWFISCVSLPQPQRIPLGLFRICLKIHGDIRKSRCNTGISFTGVVDTGGKFAIGVNDTSDKFATGVNNTSGNLPPVTMTPVATCHQ